MNALYEIITNTILKVGKYLKRRYAAHDTQL